MRYEDARLLQRWTRLMFEISKERTAREPVKLDDDGKARLDRVEESAIFKSRGYLALRKWFKQLSHGAKANARKWMTTQLQLVDKMKKLCEEQGDTFSYADLEFNNMRADNRTGELVDGPTSVDTYTKEQNASE